MVFTFSTLPFFSLKKLPVSPFYVLHDGVGAIWRLIRLCYASDSPLPLRHLPSLVLFLSLPPPPDHLQPLEGTLVLFLIKESTNFFHRSVIGKDRIISSIRRKLLSIKDELTVQISTCLACVHRKIHHS